jgi:hypothetical protein
LVQLPSPFPLIVTSPQLLCSVSTNPRLAFARSGRQAVAPSAGRRLRVLYPLAQVELSQISDPVRFGLSCVLSPALRELRTRARGLSVAVFSFDGTSHLCCLLLPDLPLSWTLLLLSHKRIRMI